MYKAFVRLHLDHGDIIYDEAYNETLTRTLNLFNAMPPQPYRELLKYRQKKNYHELALESLQRQISLFYKMFNENKPLYLFNLMRTKIPSYNTRNTDKSTPFHTKHNLFIFLLPRLLNGTSQILIFKVPLILVFSKRIRPSPNNAFNCHNCKETNNCKYLTRLRLGLSNWVNINLNIVFLILWIYFVCVTLILKQIPIFFFFLLSLTQ